ncbi:unnamed protein product [Closterium sp. NIES-54]
MRHALALVDGLSAVAPSAVLEAANFAHAASELAALRAASAAPALEHRLTKQSDEWASKARELRIVGLGADNVD